MALAGETLYVADTENHLIRKVDLRAKKVTTIAGTGKKGIAWAGLFGEVPSPPPPDVKPGSPLATALSSPWALAIHGKSLYIAMAGDHQIWKMPLDESSIGPYAGNGREDISDGPLLPNVPYDSSFAAFAQPSGLTTDGKQLFVADSEGSTVRRVPLDAKGNVQTLVGLVGTLFDFGDKDGSGLEVRLQHPLGVAWADGKLYVADTYNNKIKVVDVDRRTCHTLAGTGQIGHADASQGTLASFSEPAGISAADGKLFVADTNNHLIRVVELAAPHRVSTLTIAGLAPPKTP